MGATMSRKMQETTSTAMGKIRMKGVKSLQSPTPQTGKPQQRNQIGNQQHQHQKGNQQHQHQKGNQKQQKLTGNQQRTRQQKNQESLITSANIYLHDLTTPIIMNNKEHLKLYNSKHVEKGMKTLLALKHMGPKNQEVRDILEKYKNSLERFIDVTKPINKNLKTLFSEIYGVSPKQQKRQTQQTQRKKQTQQTQRKKQTQQTQRKKQTQQTQQELDEDELSMQANNNLFKLYKFCTTHKTVTPALAQEILVGMKALNQLKNKGYEEKYKLLSTKYEDNLRCFMKKCNESKTLTDDDYTDMKEELNKEFGTLNGI